ncbi:MAG: DUF6883 domain-containing protein [Anaerolineae bacterium]
MKLSDVVSRVTIDPRKLTEYALDPDNPVGRHKARVFERVLGFTKDNYEALLEQIEGAALTAEALLKRTDAHGRHYSVDLEITGPKGQQAVVRTGWLVAPNSDEAWLITLYVRKREEVGRQ